MANSRSHQVIVTLHFDKAIPRSHAVHHAKQHIHGEEYPYDPSDFGVEKMRYGNVKSYPKPKQQPLQWRQTNG